MSGLLAIVRSLADACHGRRLGGDDDGVGGEGAEEEGDKSVEQLRIQKQVSLSLSRSLALSLSLSLSRIVSRFLSLSLSLSLSVSLTRA